MANTVYSFPTTSHFSCSQENCGLIVQERSIEKIQMQLTFERRCARRLTTPIAYFFVTTSAVGKGDDATLLYVYATRRWGTRHILGHLSIQIPFEIRLSCAHGVMFWE